MHDSFCHAGRILQVTQIIYSALNLKNIEESSLAKDKN